MQTFTSRAWARDGGNLAPRGSGKRERGWSYPLKCCQVGNQPTRTQWGSEVRQWVSVKTPSTVVRAVPAVAALAHAGGASGSKPCILCYYYHYYHYYYCFKSQGSGLCKYQTFSPSRLELGSGNTAWAIISNTLPPPPPPPTPFLKPSS